MLQLVFELFGSCLFIFQTPSKVPSRKDDEPRSPGLSPYNGYDYNHAKWRKDPLRRSPEPPPRELTPDLADFKPMRAVESDNDSIPSYRQPMNTAPRDDVENPVEGTSDEDEDEVRVARNLSKLNFKLAG